MSKLILTVEIEGVGETIGDKENVAAALERFGKVTFIKAEEKTKASFWSDYLKNAPEGMQAEQIKMELSNL